MYQCQTFERMLNKFMLTTQVIFGRSRLLLSIFPEVSNIPIRNDKINKSFTVWCKRFKRHVHLYLSANSIYWYLMANIGRKCENCQTSRRLGWQHIACAKYLLRHEFHSRIYVRKQFPFHRIRYSKSVYITHEST